MDGATYSPLDPFQSTENAHDTINLITRVFGISRLTLREAQGRPGGRCLGAFCASARARSSSGFRYGRFRTRFPVVADDVIARMNLRPFARRMSVAGFFIRL
jgi:hypothetical protein